MGSKDFEKSIAREFNVTSLAGMDEVGRGALAGPLIAAACVFTIQQKIPNAIKDSKLLTQQQRHRVLPIIFSLADQWSVGIVEADEINQRGMGWAAQEVFYRTLRQLNTTPEAVIYDGRKIALDHPKTKNVIDGDALCKTIAAASIIAKVTRDIMMISLHEEFPRYGFSGHKGYGSQKHFYAIKKFGTLPHVHRTGFIHLEKQLSLI